MFSSFFVKTYLFTTEFLILTEVEREIKSTIREHSAKKSTKKNTNAKERIIYNELQSSVIIPLDELSSTKMTWTADGPSQGKRMREKSKDYSTTIYSSAGKILLNY